MPIKMKQKKIIIGFLFIWIACHLFSCKAKPTETPAVETKISGKVLDKTTNNAIVGSIVTTIPVTSTVTTDNSGTYTISDLRSGQYVVSAIKEGYKSTTTSVVVNEGKTALADIQLEILKPELSISNSFVDFGTNNSISTLNLTNLVGYGTLDWTVQTLANWISVSPTSGTLTTGSSTISISANRSNLTYGNYSTNLTFKSNGGNKDIPVTLSVSNPNSPQLTLSPTTLDFGNSVSTLSFTIRNTGTGKISFKISSAQNWININTVNDSLTTETKEVVVTVDRNGLSANSYLGEIVVNTNVGTQQLLVKMSVIPTPALSVVPAILAFDSIQSSASLSIANVGGGALNWVVSKNQDWINTSISSGIDNSQVEVSINRTGLNGGTHSGNILIQSNGGDINLPVTMKVPYAPSPILDITPTILSFDSTKSQLSFVVKNKGAEILTWNVNSTDGWISINPKTGTNQGTVIITVDRNLLNGGTHSGTIIITSNGGNAQINANVIAAPTNPKMFLNVSTIEFNEKGDKTFVVSNTGNGVLQWQISSNQQWVVAAPSSGSTKDVSNVTVSGDVSSFQYGDYKSDLSISSNGGNGKISVISTKLGTWTATDGEAALSLNSIYPISANNVWAVGKKILRWTGSVWVEVQNPATNSLTAVSFSSEVIGWAVGSKSNVLKYDGNSWVNISNQISDSNIEFNDVIALSDSEVILSGFSYSSFVPIVLRYNGKMWTTLTSNGTISDLVMTKSKEVYAVGNTLKKLVGDEFITINNVSAGTLSFISNNDIWINSSGISQYNGSQIVKYDDPSFPVLNISAIDMVNANDGYAGSSEGRIYRYNGETWKEIFKDRKIHCIKMLSKQEGWAISESAGGNGIIFHYK
ncbi:MAG: carboxypeptidase regulatory-like domain-containing protein [Bacteroidota bacterium]